MVQRVLQGSKLTNQLIHSLKWSALSEIASKILPPLFYIITARLLTPEDFGIVATSAMIVAFASIIWEAGLSKALIQNQDESTLQNRSNIVFYTNIFLASLLYILLIVFSDSIASFFHDSRVSDVLIVSGLSLIIGSFMSVQTALLQKNFGFKKLFYSRLIGAIIPGIVSVVMAYLGYGYWSLVWGAIASMVLQAIILWKISHWRPSFTYEIALTKEMFAFSKWVLLSALLSWFFIWGDIFVLGFYFTSHELGLYRTGNYFVGAIIGLVTAPIVPVMYSYFSKIQHDIESVKKALLFSSKVVSFFVLPIGVGIFIVQTPLVDLIFGEKWQGLAFVVGILALQQAVSWIIGLNIEAYRAIGKPNIEFNINIVAMIYYSIAYVIAAKISFEVFLYTRMILTFLTIFLHMHYSQKYLAINYLKTFENIKYIVMTLVSITIAYILTFLSSGELKLHPILFLILSFVFYIIIIFKYDFIFAKKMINVMIKKNINV